MSRTKRPRNKARHLVAVRRSGNRTEYKWEPTTALRKAGWATVMFGEISFADAVARAEEINARLDAWRLGVNLGGNAPKIAPATLLHFTFADLWHHYSRDDKDGLLAKAPDTQREYTSRYNALKQWTNDGNTRLREIDDDMVRTFRDELVQADKPYRAKAILRVLSLLMTYAEKKKMIAKGTDPSKRKDVPEPPRRKKGINQATADWLSQYASGIGKHRLALLLDLGFYTMQRSGDLRFVGKLGWREMRDIDSADRAVLCGPNGKVYGLRVQQRKTGKWVDCPLDFSWDARIRARLEAMEKAEAVHLLFYEPTGRHWHNRQINKDFRKLIDDGALPLCISARAQYELGTDEWEHWDFLIEQLSDLQFRDWRRSGMCWMRSKGVSKELIATRSGHSIKDCEDILETYMPTDTRSSGAAFAKAFVASQHDNEREQQG